jgi:hypothetical protein
MAKISKKKGSVKREYDRKVREYERKMKQLDAQLKREQAKQKKQLAQARKETREAVKREKARAEKLTYQELIRKGVDGAPIKPLLKKMPRNLRDAATKEIIQGRLDRAADVYDDVRFEAWEIAEDLDWDIGDVYDAWDYDEAQS